MAANIKEIITGKFMRDSQPAQIVLCILLGAVVGIITTGLHDIVSFTHQYVFGLRENEHLSAAAHIDRIRILFIPLGGGVVLGLFILAMKRWRSRDIIDPIEANAVFGGRMSISDSLRLLLATLISNGAGLSVGMEAAYTQMGASLTSWAGSRFQLRREDMRTFVAAGAAAAIAAAFNAPMAGAFYGFELVLGVYKISALPQVTLAAITSALFLHLTGRDEPIFSLPLDTVHLGMWDYLIFIMIGVAAALLGIITMQLVTRFEQLFKKLPVTEWLRPAVGGMVLSAMALTFPQVLGSGQGAIDNHLHNHWPLYLLAGLLAAKVLGSAISIGSGFRGGLFSASLFLGCLLGQLCGMIATHFFPQMDSQLEYFMLVGTGSVAAAIIGAPFTMVLLVLEMTGNFPATTAVLVGVMVASTITRYSFGYSFSTWRFHMRGLRILGPHDVGWVNELTMQKLMQREVKTVLSATTLSDLRTNVPAGSVKRIFVVDDLGNYKGVIEVADIYSHDLDRTGGRAALELAKGPDFFLLPDHHIREALNLFATAKLEELPVLSSAKDRRIIGSVSESYLLKRYAQELEVRNAI